MPSLPRIAKVFTLALFLCAAGLASADGLTKVAIGKAGKSATALVECKTRKAHGSAFCIHPSGLFITNEHVIRDEANLALILNAGEKTQKVFKAAVIRADREMDLALLRVEGGKDLPTLGLGSAEGLSELQELIACGFPFGTALAQDQRDYPTVSINSGSITSLRNKDGELHRIQLDAALNPGNSGGPVLDNNAKVVGVVVAGVKGAGVNFAIPINHVLKFIREPEVEFTPPAVTRATLQAPALFVAKAAALVPGGKPVELELILNSDGKDRAFTMERTDDGYRVTAAPAPATEGPTPVKTTISFGNGAIQGQTIDRGFKVDGKPIKLSQVRLIQWQNKPLVTLTDGKTLEGPLADLDALEVQLGKETVRINLASAVSLQCSTVGGPSRVTWTLVARQDGKEIKRLTNVFALPDAVVEAPPLSTDPNPTRPNDPRLTPVQPVALEGEKVTRELPSPITDIVVGGGGRFLILHLAKLRKLAVFDANQAKVVHYIPVAEDNIKFAAGREMLVVALPDAKVLQRWRLSDFEREASVPLPDKAVIKSLVMGSDSRGPILTMGGDGIRGGLTWYDLGTLKPAEIKTNNQGFLGDSCKLRASADGKTFGMWRPDTSPQGLTVLTLEGNEAKGHYEHNSAGHVIPGPDGRTIFTARGLFTHQLKPIGKVEPNAPSYFLPAQRGPFYLGFDLNMKPNQKTPECAVYLLGDSRPFAKLPNLELPEGMNGWAREAFATDRRIHFLPDAKRIITIPSSNDKLVLHPFDPQAALEKSGVNYLYVTSTPPALARKGDTLIYPIAVQSKKGGLKYRLESGPDSMSLTSEGKLLWKVPMNYETAETDVIISIRDSAGEECFHTFRIGLDTSPGPM